MFFSYEKPSGDVFVKKISSKKDLEKIGFFRPHTS